MVKNRNSPHEMNHSSPRPSRLCPSRLCLCLASPRRFVSPRRSALARLSVLLRLAVRPCPFASPCCSALPCPSISPRRSASPCPSILPRCPSLPFRSAPLVLLRLAVLLRSPFATLCPSAAPRCSSSPHPMRWLNCSHQPASWGRVFSLLLASLGVSVRFATREFRGEFSLCYP